MRFLLQVKEMKTDCYDYDWLPQEQSTWYKNVCSEPKHSRVSILVFSVLYNSVAQSPSLDTKSLQMV
jgi:hypothetical protein